MSGLRYEQMALPFVMIIVAVSAAFNFMFGWRLGENSQTITSFFHDGVIYGVLSIASDGFKICLGVLTFTLLLARNLNWWMRLVGSTICGLLFLAGTLYSLNSAFGTISQNRTDMAGIREAKATNYEALRKQLTRVEDEQSWLDQKYRAPVAIQADMAGMRQSQLWARTIGCSDATVPESREFCQRYHGLNAELGTAQRADGLAKRADELREKLNAAGGNIIADPHVSLLHELTGYSEKSIVLGWMLLLVFLSEGGSTFGPIVLWLAGRAADQKAEVAEKATGQPQEPAKPIEVSLPPEPQKARLGTTLRDLEAKSKAREKKPADWGVIETYIPKPKKPIRPGASTKVIAKSWAECFAPDGKRVEVSGPEARDHFERWCKTAGVDGKPITPLGESWFGRALENAAKAGDIDFKSTRTADHVRYVFNGTRSKQLVAA